MINSNCIDYNSEKRLRTGKYGVDRVVDFHGMTLGDAFDLLVETVNSCYENNVRCILAITGKGNRFDDGRETIKSSFPRWAQNHMIADKILRHSAATRKDGGEGAFYVLLRRKRN
ncbi:MAG: Smr/MutS family protein [Rickettsiales bacterium]|jgi:DNA-nicking Smr family endonuclease|nr:Smr/MutS family protein [Rickettsiales bacterium]